VIDQEVQSRHLRVTHEGAHAAAAHLLGHRIREIDVDRPEDGVGGWVDSEVPLDKPWRRVAYEKAIVLRCGALATNDLPEESSESDRAGVREIAKLLDIPVAAFEWDVEHEVRALMAEPRFDVAHRAICRYLADHIREKTYGEVAHRIMDDALRVVNT
jgi:hypothetical protein